MANAEGGNKVMAALDGTPLDEHALNVHEARSKKDLGSFRDRGYDSWCAESAGSLSRWLGALCESVT
jgi:hypothetical protein